MVLPSIPRKHRVWKISVTKCNRNQFCDRFINTITLIYFSYKTYNYKTKK